MISKIFCPHTPLPITETQLQLVEKLGVAFEIQGLQPAAARIDALLIVSDQTEETFDEIRETLKLSKSATSNAINLLLNLKRIEYITKSGDRKRYFRSDINQWKKNMNEKFVEMSKMTIVMKEVLAQRAEATSEFNENLADLISMFEYIFKHIPVLFKDWEKSRTNSVKP